MVVGISMVKDEADIIEATVRHMAEQCDAVWVWDNGSTDGTCEMLETLPCSLAFDDDPAHYQSDKMSRYAEWVRVQGADWVVPFDADERWITDGQRVADLLMSLPDEAMVCEAAVLNHVATGDSEMPWRRREQLPLRKVACRAREGLVIGEGNHSAHYPDLDVPLAVTGRLEVRHYPYRSAEQMIRKARNGAAALAATNLPERIGKHWRDYGRLTDEQLTDAFYKHFHSADPKNDPELVYDPCPVLLKS